MKNDHTKVTAMSEEQQAVIVDTKKVLASKEEVLRELGQIEAFEFINKLATVATLKILSKVKETKSYVGLTFTQENGMLATVANWDEFCSHKLHTPKRTVDNNLLNLKTFGEEFYESSKRVGLGDRELRKLRQLPSEDQTLIIESEAIDAGDKEAVKDLIEDLTAKHAKEKDALTTQLNESKAVANARQNLVTKADQDKQNLAEELEKLRESQQTPAPQDWLKQVQEINFLSTKLAGVAVQAINQLEDLTQRILTEELEPEHSEQALEHLAAVHVHSVDQLFVGASRLSMATRNNFEGYIDKARAMYTEKEIELLETQIIARG